jgi:hypothetical protein
MPSDRFASSIPTPRLVELIGQPGVGYTRPGEPPLPSVVFTGDEALHITAIIGGAHRGESAHASGLVIDKDCEVCVAVFAKLGDLTDAAGEGSEASR